MDFKREYSEMQEKIKPSEEFLERLEYKMNVEKEAQKLKRKKARLLVFLPIMGTVAAAAAAVTVFVNLPNRSEPAPVNPANINAADVRFPYATGVFGNENSLSDGDALPRELSEMLSQSGAALYKSDTNTFDYDDLVDDGERAALAEKIKAARISDKKAADGGDHYMLTLENGDIFKFRISEDILIFEENFYKLP
ncbi:MAG: hypothetical protein K2J77_12080 [Oscillospiraceae bacterium]|nr:hypothetical protein [Oscillospiraceae bacterium]